MVEDFVYYAKQKQGEKGDANGGGMFVELADSGWYCPSEEKQRGDELKYRLPVADQEGAAGRRHVQESADSCDRMFGRWWRDGHGVREH